MRCRRLFVAVVAMLGLTSVVWADSFSEVPAGQWAYGACARLAAAGVLPLAQWPTAADQPLLTRFEFATALLEPLASIDHALRPLGPKPEATAARAATAAALGLNPKLTDKEVARAATDLERLSMEFADELRDLGLDPATAAQGLRGLESSASVRAWRAGLFVPGLRPPAPTPRAPVRDGIQVPFGHGSMLFGYDQSTRAPSLLDYLAMSSAARANALGLLRVGVPAPSDPTIARLRTAYEYRVGSALTLRLGYEEIARRGMGAAPLDAASLTSVGIGYRITPSTSLKLSYSLADYENYTIDTPPVRDRVAETAVSVEF